MVKSYSMELLKYLEENNYIYLPNYPFNLSLDEMILSDDEETMKKVEQYSKYCLKNKELIIKENEEEI